MMRLFLLVTLLFTSGRVASFSPGNQRTSIVPKQHYGTRTSSVAKMANTDDSWKDTDLVDQEHHDKLVKKRFRKSTDPQPIMFKAMQDLFQGTTTTTTTTPIQHAVAATVVMIMLAMTPLPSNAAMSGGRIGGSSYSPSAARVMPSTRSYSRGYNNNNNNGGGYGRGFASGYASGIGTGYLTAPRYNYSPFFSPFPSFYSAPYYGGAGVISYNAGPSLGQLLFFGGLAFAVSQVLQQRETDDWTLPGVDNVGTSALGPGNSVIKMSVALDVSNRDDPGSILSVLENLGRNANTESRKGIQNLTSQVALELLRRKSSIVSATTDYKHFANRAKALREFNNQATEERGKFERENIGSTTGNVNNKATMAVVTLVLSIDGDSTKVPRIESISDVEQALRSIAADSKMDDCLQSVEILWTPEDRAETLSLKDVVADYPTLRAV